MIIEIKDLPSGRKVSRILVDITFEESSELVEQEIFSSDITTKSLIKPSESAPNNGKPDSKPPPNVPKPREPIEIPDEMLNMEF